MPLPETKVQEQLSLAYCHAVISKAGFSMTTSPVDNGIDLFVNLVERYENEYRDAGALLALQIKATRNAQIREGMVHYTLEMGAYRRLKSRCAQPRILVVYSMPDTHETWVSCTEDHMRLENCAYWIRAEDIPSGITNTHSVTIHIPIANLFDVNAVHTLTGPLIADLEEDPTEEPEGVIA